MDFSNWLKEGMKSKHDVEATIISGTVTKLKPCVTNNASREIVPRAPYASPPSQTPPVGMFVSPMQDSPFLRMEEETRNLNIITGNHDARKKFRRMEEEKRIEDQIRAARNHLSRLPMLPLNPGPTSHSCIDWGLLPGDMTQIVSAIASITGWNSFSILMACLGAVAMAMRGRYIIKPDDFWEEPVILYQLLIALSGQKKDLIVKIFKNVFDKFIDEKQLEYAENKPYLETQKAVKRRVREKLERSRITKIISDSYDKELGIYDSEALLVSSEKWVQDSLVLNSKFDVRIDESPLFFVEHTTFRGLVNLLAGQGNVMAMFREEGNSFVYMLNTKGANLDVFLKGYTMSDFICDNATSGRIHLKKPVLNILLVVQDCIVWEIYKNQKLARVGATPRFLPYFSKIEDKYEAFDTNLVKEAITLYENKIRKMLQRNYTQDCEREIFICEVEEKSSQAIKQYEAQIADLVGKGQHKHMEPFLNKLHGTAVRIAGVIHAWNYENPEQHPVTYQEMLLGIQIAHVHIDHASYAFDPCGNSAFYDAQKILDWVKRHNHNQFTARDIGQGISNMTNANICPALDLLEQHHILKQIIIPNRSRICVMHPDFFYCNIN